MQLVWVSYASMHVWKGHLYPDCSRRRRRRSSGFAHFLPALAEQWSAAVISYLNPSGFTTLNAAALRWVWIKATWKSWPVFLSVCLWTNESIKPNKSRHTFTYSSPSPTSTHTHLRMENTRKKPSTGQNEGSRHIQPVPIGWAAFEGYPS